MVHSTLIDVGKRDNIRCFLYTMSYLIQPNYRSVHLGFSKVLEKLAVKYISTH